MKILRITSNGFESGGAENGIVLTNRVLRSRGHEVRVLSSNVGLAEKGRFSDYTFRAVSGRNLLARFIARVWNHSAYRTLKRVLAEYQPDVVQLHTMYEVSPSVLFLLRDYPTVVTVHGAEDYTKGLLLWGFPSHFFKHPDNPPTPANLTDLGWLHYVYHRLFSMPLYKRGFKNVNRFLVMSGYMRDLMQGEGVISVCIPNATELFTPVPIDPASHTVLYVGRLERIKGVQDLVVAFKTVLQKVPDARLVVAGTGSYESDLHALVEKKVLGAQVQFVGHKTRGELYTLYKESAVVVMPSIWPEPFGKVGIEAMSVGRPVVATDVGGVSEWLRDGLTGYLVPPQQPHDLATTITALLTNTSTRIAMGKAAQEHATMFSIEQYVTRLEGLFREVQEKFSTSIPTSIPTSVSTSKG